MKKPLTNEEKLNRRFQWRDYAIAAVAGVAIGTWLLLIDEQRKNNRRLDALEFSTPE